MRAPRAPRKERPIATVRIRYASKRTHLERRQIAAWLTKIAADLLNEGDNFSDHFVARYFDGGLKYETQRKLACPST